MWTKEPTPKGLMIQDYNDSTVLFENRKFIVVQGEHLWGRDFETDKHEWVDGIDNLIEKTHYY